MPIDCALQLEKISSHAFAEIDAIVMRCAYASQNHFGRLFNERIYENDLAARLRAEGLSVDTQVPITLTHYGFEKIYLRDLVVNQMLYELKAVTTLLREHEMQALNYAMLQDVRLVKLINFGGSQVRGKLLSNALTESDRYHLTVQQTGWSALGPHCEKLVNHLIKVINDWGTHLDYKLYNEALIHYFGGEEHCLKRLNLQSDNLRLGTYTMQHHATDHGFVVTGLTHSQSSYHKHLETLLQHANGLKAIQWLNLNHSSLELTTIQSKS